jgi:hypothetical protein
MNTPTQNAQGNQNLNMANLYPNRGEQTDTDFIDENRVKLEFMLPLNEIVTDFFNELKHVTSGYGSFDYEDAGFKVGGTDLENQTKNTLLLYFESCWVAPWVTSVG